MKQEGGRRLSLALALVVALVTFVFGIGGLLQSDEFMPDTRKVPADVAQRIEAWDFDGTPQPTWFEYAEKVGLLRPDVPDKVYDAQRYRYFDASVAPVARERGYNVVATQMDFIEKTERPSNRAKSRVGRIIAAFGLAALISGLTGSLSGLTMFGSFRLFAWVIEGFRGSSPR
jgi:hypothetical protein